ncbi:hypothetical protein [Okeania sp. KiyG1]|uniref:hypothetical protein n=1 Tax=Okeania sp. KiyG1 TaxID=2720165 RepID=UPI001921DA7F|nr:hypothetical protein [Okeania sp. KiyG1]GGA11919.1 hypothetical protein CYANOKiyG1_25000 [Okeania sp. KiyG1]
MFNKSTRFFFIAHWRDRSIIGNYSQDQDNFQIAEANITQFLTAINQAYLPAKLKWEEISFIHENVANN